MFRFTTYYFHTYQNGKHVNSTSLTDWCFWNLEKVNHTINDNFVNTSYQSTGSAIFGVVRIPSSIADLGCTRSISVKTNDVK